jgi:hypothetical protein
MAIINNLSISYPDFQLNQIIDPDQFDVNNAEFVAKVNEIISKLNITTEVDIPQLITNVANTLTKTNTAPYNPTQPYHPSTKKYIDDAILAAVIGQLPENSITDDMLSSLDGQIKDRVDIIEENLSNFEDDFEYPLATVVSRQIQIPKLGTNKVSRFKLDSSISLGSDITISLDNGDTSLPLQNIEGVDILELEKGFYEVIADATFFTLRPSGVGGLWEHDWSAYTTVYNYTGTTTATTANSYRQFVNITGEGFLTFARGFSNDSSEGNPEMRITIDGVAWNMLGVAFDGNASGFTGNVLSSSIYFKNSLIVEVRNQTGFSQNLGCDFCYLLKNTKPNNKVQTLTKTNQRMVRVVTASSSLTTVVNVSGSGYLLAVQTDVSGTNEEGFLDISGTGISPTMSNRKIVGNQTLSFNHYYTKFPIRFTGSLLVRHRRSGTGVVDTRVWYILD